VLCFVFYRTYTDLQISADQEYAISEYCFVSFLWYGITESQRLTTYTHNQLYSLLSVQCGVWWHSWLGPCATSRKFAGSIPDGVTGIFYWQNPSGRTMALGLTEPLNRNEYQEYFLGVKAAGATGLTTLPPSCADRLEIWEP
jgi:hypothetical protein